MNAYNKNIIYAVLMTSLLHSNPEVSGKNLLENNINNNSEEKTFTLVVLPDTQLYYDVFRSRRLNIFQEQTRWIRDHIPDQNIKFVIHLGDIIQTGSDDEWKGSVYSMNLLDG